MHLELHRRYQRVWGTARIGGRYAIPLDAPQLVGDTLSFTLYHHRQVRPPLRFVGRMDGEQFRGTFQPAGAAPESPLAHWCGTRVAAGR
jgi:hypothetical protein